jgi:hypothetical protein
MFTSLLVGFGYLWAGAAFLAVIAIVLAIVACVDVFRNAELSRGSKALWAAAVIVFPFLGSLVYLGIRRDL